MQIDSILTGSRVRDCACLLLVLAAASCSEQAVETPAERSRETAGIARFPAEPLIAVAGDDSAAAFRDGLIAAGLRAKATTEPDVASRARLMADSDALVIAVSASAGPMPVSREDILLGRQFCTGPVAIGFTRCELVDDRELLELEELEMRELLNTYDLPGDTAMVFFDSPNVPTDLPRGYPAIAETLAGLEPRAALAGDRSESREFEASLYALRDQEAFERGIVRTITSGRYHVVFGHTAVEAELTAARPIAPGESGTVRITLPKPIALGQGTRLVIGNPEHVIATGTVSRQD